MPRFTLFASSTVTLSALFVSLIAADLPFVGRWKLNDQKSDLGGSITIEETSPGEYRLSQADITSVFRLDGKERPSAVGYTAIWKQLDERTWESTTKLNGKVISSERWTLSADGQTLTNVTTSLAGRPTNETGTLKRTAGSSGFTGSWKAEKMEGSNYIADIQPDGADGLVIRYEPIQWTCKAKFDGKPYPCEGPNTPPNSTMALRRVSSDSFQSTQTQDGKVTFSLVWRASPDAKTMTAMGTIGGDPASAQKTTMVWDRL